MAKTRDNPPAAPVEVVDEVPAELELDGKGGAPDGASAAIDSMGRQLGALESIMLVAWKRGSSEFDTMALKLSQRTPEGELVFELPDPQWVVLLEQNDYERVTLTAQVDERFVTLEGTLERVIYDAPTRVVVSPSDQTFWDVESGRAFRIAPNGAPSEIGTEAARKQALPEAADDAMDG